jgi:hypothetical protein
VPRAGAVQERVALQGATVEGNMIDDREAWRRCEVDTTNNKEIQAAQ